MENNNELIDRLKKSITDKLVSIEKSTRDDTTLLDYILVMVVNQKDKFEMKHNLALFLSKDTDDFVNWLFDYLAKTRESIIAETVQANLEVTTPEVPNVLTEEKSKEIQEVKKEEEVDPQPVPNLTSDLKKDEEKSSKRKLRSAVISKVWTPSDKFESSHRLNTRKRRKSFESDSNGKPKTARLEKIEREAHSDAEKRDDVKENEDKTTKFYVTLNGVKDMYKEDLVLLDDEFDPELMTEEGLPTIAAQAAKHNGIKENLSERINERCKYWPTCINGSNCEYFHPHVKCNKFPYCGFGEMCLYIHPQCKFDQHCSRQDCPFLHTVKHRVVTKESPASICKYFPNCKKPSCEFYHPKPCHFGSSCKAQYRGCSFVHPPPPPVSSAFYPQGSQLKWKPRNGKVNPNEIEIE